MDSSSQIVLVWTSPTEFKFVVLNPKEQPRFDQITHDLETLKDNFPHRAGYDWLQLRLNQVSHWYPRPFLWLLLGLIALPLRRPRGAKVLVMLPLAALTSILLDALGQTAEPRYMLPVAPAFILLGAAALLGHRRGKGTTAWSPSGSPSGHDGQLGGNTTHRKQPKSVPSKACPNQLQSR